MGATRNIGAFRTRRHARVVGRLVLLCGLALFATGCANDAIEVEALLPLEPKAASMEAATTTPGRPTAVIMAELALAELSDEKLDEMRGGIVFNAGIEIVFTIDFVVNINGDVVIPDIIGDPLNFSGIITQVVDGEATVIGTNDFTGIISLVQNSLDFQDIQNATIVHADIYGLLNSIRGSLYRSQLNFGAAAGL